MTRSPRDFSTRRRELGRAGACHAGELDAKPARARLTRARSSSTGFSGQSSGLSTTSVSSCAQRTAAAGSRARRPSSSSATSALSSASTSTKTSRSTSPRRQRGSAPRSSTPGHRGLLVRRAPSPRGSRTRRGRPRAAGRGRIGGSSLGDRAPRPRPPRERTAARGREPRRWRRAMPSSTTSASPRSSRSVALSLRSSSAASSICSRVHRVSTIALGAPAGIRAPGGAAAGFPQTWPKGRTRVDNPRSRATMSRARDATASAASPSRSPASSTVEIRTKRDGVGEARQGPRHVERREHTDRLGRLVLDHDEVRDAELQHQAGCAVEVVLAVDRDAGLTAVAPARAVSNSP